MKKIILGCAVAVCLFTAEVAHAGVKFSEIMYNPDDSDDGREWVEVVNDGPDSIDISEYRFSESGTNHKLNSVSGGTSVPVSGFAVFCANSDKFLADYPGFSGILFQSSFSLSNSGETLSLKDSSLSDADSVLYSSAMGGNEDGKSLQKIGGSWTEAVPTPGAENQSSGSGNVSQSDNPSASQNSLSSATASDSSSSQNLTASAPAKNGPFTVKAYADPKVAVVGAPIIFKASALNSQKKEISGVYFSWNFGNGSVVAGQPVAEYTYYLPGSYTVSLIGDLNSEKSEDRFVMNVITSPFSISQASAGKMGVIEIVNSSGYELSLARWIISSNGREFRIPEGTYISASGKISFPAFITGIDYDGNAMLLYPNRTLAYSFSHTQAVTVNANLASYRADVPVAYVGTPVFSYPDSAPITAESAEIKSENGASEASVSQNLADAVFAENSSESESAQAGNPRSNKIYGWAAGALALVALGVISVLFAKDGKKEGDVDVAEEFEIIE